MVCVRTVTHGRGGLGRRIGQQHGSFKVLILIFYSGMKKKKRLMFGTPFLILIYCVVFYKQQPLACWAGKPPSYFPRCGASSLLWRGGGSPRVLQTWSLWGLWCIFLHIIQVRWEVDFNLQISTLSVTEGTHLFYMTRERGPAGGQCGLANCG